jgi:hypothetical protein
MSENSPELAVAPTKQPTEGQRSERVEGAWSNISINSMHRLRPWRLKRPSLDLLGNLLGAGGATFSALAMLVCCGFTGVANLVSAVGLGMLVRTDVGLPVLYVFLAFNLATLLWSARTHRRPYPVLLSLGGAGLLHYVWNHALEVWVWLTVMYAGVALVLLASGLNLWLRRRCRVKAPVSN